MALSEQGESWLRKAVAFLGVLSILVFGAGIGDTVTVRDLAKGAPAFIFLTTIIYIAG